MELSEKYGNPRWPSKVHGWEAGRAPRSLSRLDEATGEALVRFKSANQDSLFKFAAKCVTYLWVMDVDGVVHISVEELALMPDGTDVTGYPRRRDFPVHPVEEKKLGHPTLVNGERARMGGELFLDNTCSELCWYINVNSGRYCKDAPPSETQVQNILTLFREAVETSVEFDDIRAA